jgi:hypothetical protein
MILAKQPLPATFGTEVTLKIYRRECTISAKQPLPATFGTEVTLKSIEFRGKHLQVMPDRTVLEVPLPTSWRGRLRAQVACVMLCRSFCLLLLQIY